MELGLAIHGRNAADDVRSPKSPLGKNGHQERQSKREREEEKAREEEQGEDRFKEAMKEFPQMMRRGTLDSIQKEVNASRKTDRAVHKTIRDARKACEETDFVIDQCMRRLTLANSAVQKLHERCKTSANNNFAMGTKEFSNWNKLRHSAHGIIDAKRKTKLQEQVASTTKLLESLGRGSEHPARRPTL